MKKKFKPNTSESVNWWLLKSQDDFNKYDESNSFAAITNS